MAAGGGGELAEREEQVFRHAVEHALGIEYGAFGVVVTPGVGRRRSKGWDVVRGVQRAMDVECVRPGVLGAQLNELPDRNHHNWGCCKKAIQHSRSIGSSANSSPANPLRFGVRHARLDAAAHLLSGSAMTSNWRKR